MIDYSERFSNLNGRPQVRCYKCGKLFAYLDKGSFSRVTRDENELLRRLYSCPTCRLKLKKIITKE